MTFLLGVIYMRFDTNTYNIIIFLLHTQRVNVSNMRIWDMNVGKS